MNKLTCGKFEVNITNPDKVLFPKANITKKQIIEYYYNIAEHMLPYLEDRLVSMERYPNGISEPGFFHKNSPDFFPDYIKIFPIEKKDGNIVNHAVINNQATLVYLANYGCLTPHVWLSRTDKLDYPDRLIFDLDPSADNFELVRQKAIDLKKLLESLGLPVFTMLTGSRGIHLVTPLKPLWDFDMVRAFALKVAEKFVATDPDNLTLEIRKENRGNKIFVDILRNAWGATSAPPYSVRAKEGAPVAAPLFAGELEDKNLSPQQFNISNIFNRLQEGNPWKDLPIKAVALKSCTNKEIL
jgi:bifunctional non-homologous end joining protein LigD